WGMSETLGPISFVAPQDDGLPAAFQQRPYSEATSVLIDAEVRHIVDKSQREAARLLAEHRDQLDSLAHALLSAESLNGAEIRDATGLKERPAPEPEVLGPVAAGAGEIAAGNQPTDSSAFAPSRS
ncbi:MAG: hypothetical protein R6V57_13875, partial [Vicinamibacterales bacterium]